MCLRAYECSCITFSICQMCVKRIHGTVGNQQRKRKRRRKHFVCINRCYFAFYNVSTHNSFHQRVPEHSASYTLKNGKFNSILWKMCSYRHRIRVDRHARYANWFNCIRGISREASEAQIRNTTQRVKYQTNWLQWMSPEGHDGLELSVFYNNNNNQKKRPHINCSTLFHLADSKFTWKMTKISEQWLAIPRKASQLNSSAFDAYKQHENNAQTKNKIIDNLKSINKNDFLYET